MISYLNLTQSIDSYKAAYCLDPSQVRILFTLRVAHLLSYCVKFSKTRALSAIVRNLILQVSGTSAAIKVLLLKLQSQDRLCGYHVRL